MASAVMLTPAAQWGPGAVLAFALAWGSLIDIDRLILPDPITLGLTVVGLLLAVMEGPEAALEKSIGAALGYGVLALLAWAYRNWRGRDGLGGGDGKLLMAAGAWLGWGALPAVVLIGSGAGLLYVLARTLVARRFSADEALPFGPFLAIGIWAMWLVIHAPSLG
ncbi:hypothetical protein GC169_00435 [bacterium]|nr:hypothetical protein [bacterium]